MKIKGTQLFVKALIEEGVDTLFAYPGGMAIDIFDALYGETAFNVVLPRHEQGLVHAADGYARATGKTGVCLVTSGPGATNLVTGIATANYDSVPLVCFTGQVPTNLIGNDAFQEVDIVGICRSICKYAVTVRRREDLGRIIKEAFYIARTGKPGPVLVDFPKDIQNALGSDEYPKEVSIRGYKPSTGVHMGQLKKAADMLVNARRPLFLAGGGVNISGGGEAMTKLAEAMQVPVITTVMGKGSLPTDHPLYIGNMGMHGNVAANTAVSECDLLFSIGTRFNDRITGKISEFAKGAKIVHIDIDAASISRNIVVDVPIVADAKEAIEKFSEIAVPPKHAEGWLARLQALKAEKPISMPREGALTPQDIIEGINEQFPEAIVTTDVGQNQMWTTQFLQLRGRSKLITSGGLGTMGYGLPAAIGAALGRPEMPVVSVSGDGGFQMNEQELATAACQELPIVICILNNSYLGNVRQWQEMFYGGRYSCTCLKKRKGCAAWCSDPSAACPPYIPDFVKLAESYGIEGIRVTKREDIAAAFVRAKANRKAPTLIEFIIERECNILPMVPGGNALSEMVTEFKKEENR
ncbi:MAG TPA: biosynthetic-type acetolactate synthase large subunit [Candidatus Borkfalkia excrementigallinarum]|uniref:Acetolactate synthase n=1 Tax=Candidatus Borkfalkia excrementigallinarum TaxID=2838506 RepID=A0A9D1ZW80_9FIRM|nr:biosynthetic-type acetolactate synthase large subunit [Candidatus Borkfalkia excrementigallinarum]